MVTGVLKADPPKYHLPDEPIGEYSGSNSNTNNDPLKLVSLGKPWLGQTVKIVDSNTLNVLGEPIQ